MVVCGGQDGGLVWGSLPRAASLIVNGLPSTVSLFDRSGAATYCSSAPGHRLFFSPSHICLCVIFSLGHCFISDSSLPCDRVFRVPYSFSCVSFRPPCRRPFVRLEPFTSGCIRHITSQYLTKFFLVKLASGSDK